MITPGHDDIGSPVLYLHRGGGSEQGEITSFNERWVFVRYPSNRTSMATARENLIWMHAGRQLMEPATEAVTTYTCPKCGRVSHNQRDREERFCAVCGFEEP